MSGGLTLLCGGKYNRVVIEPLRHLAQSSLLACQNHMPVHIVKQGDSLTSIADQYGFFWQTLWNHPRNSQLKAQRQNPNILMAGDQVFIPAKRLKDEPSETGKAHRFRVRGTPARLNLRLKDAYGQPRAGIQYTLKVDDQTFSGRTDGDGKLSHVIPPSALKAQLRLETGEQWNLDLGHINPVEYLSGVQARLKNLGYFKGQISGTMDDETRDALRVFQSAQGLSATGEPDQATRDALVDAHES
jgi:hypothetical protein